MTRCRFVLLLFVCLALVLHAPPAGAQSAATTGAIEGTVLDESGGVLPGVSVALRNTATNYETTVTTGPNGRFRVRTPKLGISVNGAGDAIAALFFVHAAETGDVALALSRAASSTYGLLKRTAEAGSREILTVAAQDEFVTPSRVFTPETI